MGFSMIVGTSNYVSFSASFDLRLSPPPTGLIFPNPIDFQF